MSDQLPLTLPTDFALRDNSYTVSGLKELRAAMAGRIVDVRRELDKLQGDCAPISRGGFS